MMLDCFYNLYHKHYSFLSSFFKAPADDITFLILAAMRKVGRDHININTIMTAKSS